MIYSRGVGSAGWGGNLPSHQQCNLTDLPGDNPTNGKLHLSRFALTDLTAAATATQSSNPTSGTDTHSKRHGHWQCVQWSLGSNQSHQPRSLFTPGNANAKEEIDWKERLRVSCVSRQAGFFFLSFFSFFLQLGHWTAATHLLQSASITALTYSQLICRPFISFFPNNSHFFVPPELALCILKQRQHLWAFCDNAVVI